ncbi:hypothetical protein KY285_032185, partial [Solanum tuberosum]
DGDISVLLVRSVVKGSFVTHLSLEAQARCFASVWLRFSVCKAPRYIFVAVVIWRSHMMEIKADRNDGSLVLVKHGDEARGMVLSWLSGLSFACLVDPRTTALFNIHLFSLHLFIPVQNRDLAECLVTIRADNGSHHITLGCNGQIHTHVPSVNVASDTGGEFKSHVGMNSDARAYTKLAKHSCKFPTRASDEPLALLASSLGGAKGD